MKVSIDVSFCGFLMPKQYPSLSLYYCQTLIITGNPPEALDDLEKYIIDHAENYNLHLEEIIRPPNDDSCRKILDWCKQTSFEGGGILIFRKC
jgi:hypothetical protein